MNEKIELDDIQIVSRECLYENERYKEYKYNSQWNGRKFYTLLKIPLGLTEESQKDFEVIEKDMIRDSLYSLLERENASIS